jgi:hypothetical protein
VAGGGAGVAPAPQAASTISVVKNTAAPKRVSTSADLHGEQRIV